MNQNHAMITIITVIGHPIVLILHAVSGKPPCLFSFQKRFLEKKTVIPRPVASCFEVVRPGSEWSMWLAIYEINCCKYKYSH